MKLHLVQADCFDDIDDSGDGYIDAAELVDEYNIPEIVANSYITAFDKNGDGKLDPADRTGFKLIGLLCTAKNLLIPL